MPMRGPGACGLYRGCKEAERSARMRCILANVAPEPTFFMYFSWSGTRDPHFSYYFSSFFMVRSSMQAPAPPPHAPQARLSFILSGPGARARAQTLHLFARFFQRRFYFSTPHRTHPGDTAEKRKSGGPPGLAHTPPRATQPAPVASDASHPRSPLRVRLRKTTSPHVRRGLPHQKTALFRQENWQFWTHS